MKHIYLLRHASAESGFRDHSRNLSPLGESEARQAGAWLCKHNIYPEIIFHSDAARTTRTAQELNVQTQIQAVPELYLASADTLLNYIRENTPDTVHTIMIVAHNPGIAELAFKLGHSDDIRSYGYPPATCAEIICDTESWTGLQVSDCKLGRLFKA